jgi:hypothetical protein
MTALTRSPRWLAGTRANKHRPIARTPRASDFAPRSKHRLVCGWLGGPGEAGFECSCGAGFDGFDSIDEAEACHRPNRQNHAERAVDIRAVIGARWGIANNPGAAPGALGRSAATMTVDARGLAYVRQAGRLGTLTEEWGLSAYPFTARQGRRLRHKAHRSGEHGAAYLAKARGRGAV